MLRVSQIDDGAHPLGVRDFTRKVILRQFYQPFEKQASTQQRKKGRHTVGKKNDYCCASFTGISKKQASKRACGSGKQSGTRCTKKKL